MKLIGWIVFLFVGAVVLVHGYFYVALGSVDPCKAAVTHIIQKERQKGNDLAASAGVLFSDQLEGMLRDDGMKTCYRSALTGDLPEVAIRFSRDGVRTGANH
jgi:hypothetical protein